jgi:hypothetical protein
MNILLFRAYDKIKKDAGRSKQFVGLKDCCDAAREALEKHEKKTGSSPVSLELVEWHRLVAAGHDALALISSRKSPCITHTLAVIASQRTRERESG